MRSSRADFENPVAAEMVVADISQIFPDREKASILVHRHCRLIGGIVFALGAIAFIVVLLTPGEASAAAAEFAADKAAAPAKGKKKGKGKGKGGKDAESKDESESDPEVVGTLRKGSPGEPSYYTLPDMLVNLASQEGRPYFLKLKLTLESEDYHTFDGVPKIMPRLTDSLLLFLRELHIDDLNGTAGGYRLRLELLRRLNKAMAPRQIDAVLIEEMLIQ